MFFDRQKKYNAKVSALLPIFGINLEENGLNKLLPLLKTVRENKFNEHEAAITVATYYVQITKPLNNEIASTLFDKIEVIQHDWITNDLLRPQNVIDIKKKREDIFGPSVPNKDLKEYPFSNNMPNITKGERLRTYSAKEMVALLVRDAPSIGESVTGQAMPLKFPYTLVLIDNTNGEPVYYVTFEKGITEGAFLCIFGRDGQHSNLGEIDESMPELEFEKKAIEIIEKEFNIGLTVNSA